MNDERMPQQRLLDLLSGFWITQLIATFARLDLADALAGAPQSAEALAVRCAADPDALARLLAAAASQQLVERIADGRWRLTALGGTLRRGRAGSLRDYAITMGAPAHWQAWTGLEDAVRSGAPVFERQFGCSLWQHYARAPEEGAAFSGAMGELSQLVALDLQHAIDPASARCIVDVGGAQGTLLSALLQRAPRSRGVLFDRPEAIARARAQAPPLSPRITCVAGDFFDAVPPGDVYLLKQILHDYGDDDCLRLLRALRSAGGAAARLWIVEMPLPSPGAPSPAWLVDLNMLVLLGGRERSVPEYAALLARAGFSLTRSSPLRGGFALLEARPAGAPAAVPAGSPPTPADT